MNLPRIEQPTYEVKLLSRDQPVKYRPFLVKEQKIMMMAVEAKEVETTLRAIKQIITNCLISPINVDDLPLADLETMFLNLRARSMGEVISLYFKCTNMVDYIPAPNTAMSHTIDVMGNVVKPQIQCGMVIEVPVNLITDVKQTNTGIDKKIMVSDDIGVIMKYPSLEMVDKLLKANDSQVMYTVVASCLDTIFDKESVWKANDATTEELIDFVEHLPGDKFDLLTNFIDNIPKSKFETKKKCPKCHYEHDFVLEGLSDFFT
jgi:hypothetical protein